MLTQVGHFNQGSFSIRGEHPFEDGACLRLAHVWLTLAASGSPFNPVELNTHRIREDQRVYLESGDKLRTSARLSDFTVWESLTRLSAFALENWGGGTWEYNHGLAKVEEVLTSTQFDGAILCVYGTDVNRERWGHAMGLMRDDRFFDPNSGEWRLTGSVVERARALKLYFFDHVRRRDEAFGGIRFIAFRQ